MDIQNKFLRAKLATLLVGTNMLQYLFEKRMDSFMFQRRLKEIGSVNFKPNLWNFLNLYDLCTRGAIKELEPTEGWITCSINPHDVTLGDDIKRLHGLLEKINALETNMHEYKFAHEDICRILKDIIKRFSGSERRDFTNVFRNIMSQSDLDEIVPDLKTILDTGEHANNILQKYEKTKNSPKLYTSLESKKDMNYLQHESSIHKCMLTTGTCTDDDSRNINKIRECLLKSTEIKRFKPSRDYQEVRSEGEQMTNPLEEQENRVPKFVKWQIYFEFVPPPLNTFDYSMNKISNIERCLQRMYPSNAAPEAIVPKYMSFAFVHGNHMDLNHASMKLFDAEPAEKNNKDNDSGIVVVYLDRDTTFESLEIAIKNTENLHVKRKGGCVFLAVHSEILLQDRGKLRSLLKPFLESGINIQDANGKLSELYKRFARLKAQAIKDIEKRLKSLKDDFGSNEKLRALGKQILKLKREDDQNEDGCSRTENATWSNSTLSRLKDLGLQGYTIKNNTLILCFQRQPTQTKIARSMLPKEICMKYPNIEIIENKDNLFKCHHEVRSGDKLHPRRRIARRYGTIGMFGAIFRKDEPSRNCCISSPHVISCEQTAYILNATLQLGTCIWPPSAANNCINVEDISIICLDQHDIQIERNVNDDVRLFDRDRRQLKDRKVYKFGATTLRTTGYIRNSEFILTIGNSVKVFLIEPEDDSDDNSPFSKPGDSGAIVFTKFGQNVVVLSMIFGGEVTLPGIAQNNSIGVDLNEAIRRFTINNHGQNIQLDTL